MFELGKFSRDVLREFEITNRITFHLTKTPVRVKENNMELFNFIFTFYDGSYYSLSELKDIIESYTFNYKELKIKTQYLDYNFLSRYASEFIKYTEIDNIYPSERIKFPQNVIIPYIHAKYAQLPINEYIKFIEYTFSEPISGYLLLFDKFLTDVADASQKFLKIKSSIDVNKIMVVDSLEKLGNKNTLLLSEKVKLKVPKFNLTTLMYLLYAYKLSYITFVVDNPQSEFINTSDSMVVVPTIYDSNVTIINTNMLKTLEKPTTEKFEFLSSMFDILSDTEPKKLFYSPDYNLNNTFFIDLGEIIVGYTRFGVDKGILFLRKYVQDGKVYLRIIPDFTRAIIDEHPDKKNVYMQIDKLEKFVSSYSKGVTSFFIDPNLNRLFIVHYPYAEPDKTYYTEVPLSNIRNRLGLVNGILVVGDYRFKIFNTYGYLHILNR